MLPRVVRALVRRKRGASYALPAALVAPIYLAFVAIVFELGFLLLAGLGTCYAAYAAARSAAVWHSAEPADVAALRPRQAAWAALAPFLIGRQRGPDTAGPVPPEATASAAGYTAALGRSSGDLQFRIAAARTTVTVEPVAGGQIRATVAFRAPLYFPVASRLLSRGRPAFEYPIAAVAELPNEAPSGGPGIDYSPATRKTP